jgi:hypothetical protein
MLGEAWVTRMKTRPCDSEVSVIEVRGHLKPPLALLDDYGVPRCQGSKRPYLNLEFLKGGLKPD